MKIMLPLGVGHWFCTGGGDFGLPGDKWQTLETFLDVTTGARGVLMASSAWSPGMLLSILESTGRPHSKRWASRTCRCRQG